MNSSSTEAQLAVIRENAILPAYYPPAKGFLLAYFLFFFWTSAFLFEMGFVLAIKWYFCGTILKIDFLFVIIFFKFFHFCESKKF